MGAQASWLLPAALLALVVGLWHSRRAPRTDRTRAALLLWGGWLLVTAAVFSFGQGVIHTYYTVALVPAIAALIAITGSVLWRVRETAGARITAAVAVLITTAWSYVLLDRTPHWEAWLRPLIVVSAVLAVVGLLAAPALGRLGRRAPMRRRGRVRAAGLPRRARRLFGADDHDRAHGVDPLRGTGVEHAAAWGRAEGSGPAAGDARAATPSVCRALGGDYIRRTPIPVAPRWSDAASGSGSGSGPGRHRHRAARKPVASSCSVPRARSDRAELRRPPREGFARPVAHRPVAVTLVVAAQEVQARQP